MMPTYQIPITKYLISKSVEVVTADSIMEAIHYLERNGISFNEDDFTDETWEIDEQNITQNEFEDDESNDLEQND